MTVTIKSLLSIWCQTCSWTT